MFKFITSNKLRNIHKKEDKLEAIDKIKVTKPLPQIQPQQSIDNNLPKLKNLNVQFTQFSPSSSNINLNALRNLAELPQQDNNISQHNSHNNNNDNNQSIPLTRNSSLPIIDNNQTSFKKPSTKSRNTPPKWKFLKQVQSIPVKLNQLSHESITPSPEPIKERPLTYYEPPIQSKPSLMKLRPNSNYDLLDPNLRRKSFFENHNHRQEELSLNSDPYLPISDNTIISEHTNFSYQNEHSEEYYNKSTMIPSSQPMRLSQSQPMPTTLNQVKEEESDMLSHPTLGRFFKAAEVQKVKRESSNPKLIAKVKSTQQIESDKSLGPRLISKIKSEKLLYDKDNQDMRIDNNKIEGNVKRLSKDNIPIIRPKSMVKDMKSIVEAKEQVPMTNMISKTKREVKQEAISPSQFQSQSPKPITRVKSEYMEPKINSPIAAKLITKVKSERNMSNNKVEQLKHQFEGHSESIEYKPVTKTNNDNTSPLNDYLKAEDPNDPNSKVALAMRVSTMKRTSTLKYRENRELTINSEPLSFLSMKNGVMSPTDITTAEMAHQLEISELKARIEGLKKELRDEQNDKKKLIKENENKIFQLNQEHQIQMDSLKQKCAKRMDELIQYINELSKKEISKTEIPTVNKEHLNLIREEDHLKKKKPIGSLTPITMYKFIEEQYSNLKHEDPMDELPNLSMNYNKNQYDNENRINQIIHSIENTTMKMESYSINKMADKKREGINELNYENNGMNDPINNSDINSYYYNNENSNNNQNTYENEGFDNNNNNNNNITMEINNNSQSLNNQTNSSSNAADYQLNLKRELKTSLAPSLSSLNIQLRHNKPIPHKHNEIQLQNESIHQQQQLNPNNPNNHNNSHNHNSNITPNPTRSQPMVRTKSGFNDNPYLKEPIDLNHIMFQQPRKKPLPSLPSQSKVGV
ncbi:hypothetical protein K502DRAFT_342245 [Neoconidiobolus thromboides FSU 785]|nr:hypothetical protein K502DRAFT_342245 [Neoconidiobolus thromboides FSU 785]